ncbi:hypothetical protein MASR2M15_11140 [Anaerolineales bacterium]
MTLEIIAPGVGWYLYEERIIVYQIETVVAESLDMWLEHVQKKMSNWDQDQSYLALYKLIHPDITFTPYVRELAIKVNSIYPEISGRVALLMVEDMMSTLMDYFAKGRTNTPRPLKVFHKEAEALAWLKEMLEVE